MTVRTALFTAFIALIGTSPALAQAPEASASGPGKVEISIIPGGGVFFTEGKDTRSPSFGNYDLGGSVAVNFNRYVGVEGELSGALGVSQSLDFNGASLTDAKTPHLLNYSGNVVVHVANGPVVPYVTGGVGGLSLFERADLGINDTNTFLTGNVGAGIKWYSGRFGLRGDYRFIAVQSQDDAPAFFGQETRYGHRVYGGVIINVAR
ncbi:MAG TPA: outer membrane beta-barrel protein [Vicinamibacterales bacterium]|nr:outer membrane beta-barrel protein [Vicinamibacterales bacterium]